MVNTLGTDIQIHVPDPKKAAKFYVEQLGFEVTDETPDFVSILGDNINLFLERGPLLGPVLEVTVRSVKDAKKALKDRGCEIVLDEPKVPRCYVRDPYGLIYNLTEGSGDQPQ